MPPLDALTAKAVFLDQMHTQNWRIYIDGYADSLAGRRSTHRKDTTFWPETTTGEVMAKHLAHLTQMSHAYYVAPEMQNLVTAASHDWAEDEPVREDDFPQPQGWMYIPGGITVLDIRGQPMESTVLLWDCHGGGVDVHYLADKTAPADTRMRVENPQGWKEMPRYTPWCHIRMEFGQPVVWSLQMGKAIPPEVADQINTFNTPDGGVGMYFPEGWKPEEMKPHAEPSPTMVWLVSCLRIMQMPLASVTRLGLPAQYRKDLSRYKTKLKQTLVSVIEYRRRKGEYSHDSGRTISYRYFRRGHWRQQPFKNADGAWETKRIRIQPTIVGDPSLPLVLREHVNAFTR